MHFTKTKIISNLIKRIQSRGKTRNVPILKYPAQFSNNRVRSKSTGSTQEHPIKNKVALITGGTRGIGLECAVTLLKCKAKGVMLADLDACEGKNVISTIAKDFGPGKVGFIETNVCCPEQFDNAFKSTLDVFKQIDIVVNNAGIFNDCQWEKSLKINCAGVTTGTLLGFKYMRKDGKVKKGETKGRGGAIVNMSAMLALQEIAGCPMHVAQKTYVIALSRCFGQLYHFCPTGVKVLTLCPGLTLGSMTATALNKPMNDHLKRELRELKCQPMCYVAKALISVLCKGESGSVWISENCFPAYKIELPSIESMRPKKAQPPESKIKKCKAC